MLQTTRAVVLRTIRHGDRTTILKAYTEAFGARSYMVRTSAKGAVRATHLQPLARLELVVTEDHERDLHAVREARIEKPFVGVPAEPVRGILLLFAQEVFLRTLREESPDQALFDFVQRTLEDIDTGPDPGQQPLMLLAGLCGHLGFRPTPPAGGEHRFDMREGFFFKGPSPHVFCMEPATSRAFAQILGAMRDNTPARVEPASRKALLDDLLTFFRFHVEGFGQLRSPEVFHHLLH